MNGDDKTPPLLTQLFDNVLSKAAKLVAPDSLVHVPADEPYTEKEWSHNVNRSHNIEEALKKSLKRLRPGDIILTHTPGVFYDAARATANSTYDHCVVVAHNGMVYHVGPPTVRCLRMERFVTPQRYPRVFRTRLKPKQIRRFLMLLERNLGKRYDTFAAYKTLATLSFEHITGATLSQSQKNNHQPGQHQHHNSNTNTHMVCTDTILSALCKVSKAFTLAIASCEPTLDCVRFQDGAASLKDILRLHRHRPDLLVRIPLMTSLFPNEPPPPSLTSTIPTTMTVKNLMGAGQGVYMRAKIWAAILNNKLEETLGKPEMLKMTNVLERAGLVVVDKEETAESAVGSHVIGSNRITAVGGETNSHGRTAQYIPVVRDLVSSSETSASGKGRDDVIDDLDNSRYLPRKTDHERDRQYNEASEERDVTIRWKKMQGALVGAMAVLAWSKRRRVMYNIFRTTVLLLVVRYGVLKMRRRWTRSKL